MQTWKRTMGVDGKVFVIKGKYPDLRAALLERGWVENMDKKSNFFDLRWTSKIIDINFPGLRPNQIVNHFDNNACLTSKYGLIKSIRAVMYPENMDTDRFFPKAFDLSHLGDF
jgi:tubulin monoglycylase TTLL3/8